MIGCRRCAKFFRAGQGGATPAWPLAARDTPWDRSADGRMDEMQAKRNGFSLKLPDKAQLLR